jgi:hypothetical protein
METLLLWLVRLTAVATLLPGFFVLWYMAGSDDTPQTVVAPFLVLGVMAGAIWGVVAAFSRLPGEPVEALAIFTLTPGLFLVGRPFSGPEATGRPGFLEYVTQAPWLAGPLLAGALYLARVARGHMAAGEVEDRLRSPRRSLG